MERENMNCKHNEKRSVFILEFMRHGGFWGNFITEYRTLFVAIMSYKLLPS